MLYIPVYGNDRFVSACVPNRFVFNMLEILDLLAASLYIVSELHVGRKKKSLHYVLLSF